MARSRARSTSRKRTGSRARRLGVLVLLLAGGLAGAVFWGSASGVDSAAAALESGADAGDVGQAFAEPAAEPAPPPRPKRQIVPDLEVVVNIPSGRLQLVAGDSVVRSYPVSVGSARYPTPTGDFLLATVIWNPWWRPPPESGWAANRKPEPPGPNNPMGRVKLHMDELIYIHGTNAEGRLGAPASHGCIRMSNADVVDLARRLNRFADPEIDESELERVSQPGRTERHTVMARSVRMRVTYQVAQLRGERLHVYPDVYGTVGGDFASHVREQMARGGADTAQVPSAAMARLRASAAERGGASFALAEIPSLRPLPPAPPRETGPRLLGTPVSAPRAAPDTIVLGAADAAAPGESGPDAVEAVAVQP